MKLDKKSGRWYRIKDSEARDKVGHAIRKAVQRLEETQPKQYERLKKEYSEKAAAKAEAEASSEGKEREDAAEPDRQESIAEKGGPLVVILRDFGDETDRGHLASR